MCCLDILAAEDQVRCCGKRKGLCLDVTVDFEILCVVLMSPILNNA